MGRKSLSGHHWAPEGNRAGGASREENQGRSARDAPAEVHAVRARRSCTPPSDLASDRDEESRTNGFSTLPSMCHASNPRGRPNANRANPNLVHQVPPLRGALSCPG